MNDHLSRSAIWAALLCVFGGIAMSGIAWLGSESMFVAGAFAFPFVLGFAFAIASAIRYYRNN